MNLLAYLKGLFRPALSTILADLNRTVARLEAHAEHHDAQAEAKLEQVAALHAEVEEHDVEATRAGRIAANLSKLTS